MRSGARVCGLAIAAVAASAQVSPPTRPADGGLVVATSSALAPFVRRAAAAVAADSSSPKVTVLVVGSDVAMADLYTGRADAAVIGREASENEVKAFTWVFRRPPVATVLGCGSVATPGLSPALSVRVNARNPLTTISLAGLRAAFRVDGETPTWGELGLTGAWARRPIHLVIPDAESGTGRFLRHVVLADAVQFDWRRVTEITPVGTDALLHSRIDAAIARDELALGLGAAINGGRAKSVSVTSDKDRFATANRTDLRQFIRMYSLGDHEEELRPMISNMHNAFAC